MYTKLERKRKEAALFKVSFWQLAPGIEENNEKPRIVGLRTKI
jgi:hypothetical protein